MNPTHHFFESEMPSIVPEMEQVFNKYLLLGFQGDILTL